MAKAKELEEEVIENAKKKAQEVLNQAEERAQKIEDQRIQKMEVIQTRLLEREEKLDQKLEKVEEEKQKIMEKLEEEKNKYIEKQKQVDLTIQQQTDKLAEVAKLSEPEAKDLLLKQVESKYQSELVNFIEKLKTIKKEEADKEAAKIISEALPRVSSENVVEFTTKTVDLPNEDFK